jgi:hypothetical protein
MLFADLAARLDELEGIRDDWPGFGPEAMSEVIAAAEVEAMAATPATNEDRAWMFARLERSIANGWTDEARAPLLAMLARAVKAQEAASGWSEFEGRLAAA